ncbi:MAG TPA: ABC transporter substrate-binding protein [Burkholderiales bacterium]|jgi:putative ABC transport system substrate-binding protein|nr:ABC transporter substrate-binding protein [Burkholderiales bacterium]
MRLSRYALLLAVAVLTAGAWSGECWAQAKLPRVGILTGDVDITSDHARQWWEPFQRTLADRGWIDGKNVSFEFRKSSGDPPQFAAAAAEIVRLKVDVIWATNAPATRAAFAATRTIPIVGWDLTTDPVEAGYIESYARPGGNLTGVFLDAPELAGKWVELLKTTVPGLSTVVVLWDPSPGVAHLHAVESAAVSFGVRPQVIEVRKPEDIDRAFASIRGRPRALIVLPSPMLYFQSERLAKLALKNQLLATSIFRLFAEVGGTLAYGPDIVLVSERGAVLVAKILGGAKPAELPVERPTKVQLVVNLKSAKALGITIPQSILLRADEVIR